ncbi:MAG: hypothetical protein JWR10_1685 [Rubritepida sp.]|nr:hypothetical protein [Rubritepida sp.]
MKRWKWLVPLAVAAYGLRFGSSWLTLALAGDRRFDPHGFGLLGDAILLSALFLPALGLLLWILRRNRPWRGLLSPASVPLWTGLSVLLFLLIGAPTPGQAWALVLLPLAESWPVLLSALLWFAVAGVLRALAVASPEAPVAGER